MGAEVLALIDDNGIKFLVLRQPGAFCIGSFRQCMLKIIIIILAFGRGEARQPLQQAVKVAGG